MARQARNRPGRTDRPAAAQPASAGDARAASNQALAAVLHFEDRKAFEAIKKPKPAKKK